MDSMRRNGTQKETFRQHQRSFSETSPPRRVHFNDDSRHEVQNQSSETNKLVKELESSYKTIQKGKEIVRRLYNELQSSKATSHLGKNGNPLPTKGNNDLLVQHIALFCQLVENITLQQDKYLLQLNYLLNTIGRGKDRLSDCLKDSSEINLDDSTDQRQLRAMSLRQESVIRELKIDQEFQRKTLTELRHKMSEDKDEIARALSSIKSSHLKLGIDKFSNRKNPDEQFTDGLGAQSENLRDKLERLLQQSENIEKFMGREKNGADNSKLKQNENKENDRRLGNDVNEFTRQAEHSQTGIQWVIDRFANIESQLGECSLTPIRDRLLQQLDDLDTESERGNARNEAYYCDTNKRYHDDSWIGRNNHRKIREELIRCLDRISAQEHKFALAQQEINLLKTDLNAVIIEKNVTERELRFQLDDWENKCRQKDLEISSLLQDLERARESMASSQYGRSKHTEDLLCQIRDLEYRIDELVIDNKRLSQLKRIKKPENDVDIVKLKMKVDEKSEEVDRIKEEMNQAVREMEELRNEAKCGHVMSETVSRLSIENSKLIKENQRLKDGNTENISEELLALHRAINDAESHVEKLKKEKRAAEETLRFKELEIADAKKIITKENKATRRSSVEGLDDWESDFKANKRLERMYDDCLAALEGSDKERLQLRRENAMIEEKYARENNQLTEKVDQLHQLLEEKANISDFDQAEDLIKIIKQLDDEHPIVDALRTDLQRRRLLYRGGTKTQSDAEHRKTIKLMEKEIQELQETIDDLMNSIGEKEKNRDDVIDELTHQKETLRRTLHEKEVEIDKLRNEIDNQKGEIKVKHKQLVENGEEHYAEMGRLKTKFDGEIASLHARLKDKNAERKAEHLKADDISHELDIVSLEKEGIESQLKQAHKLINQLKKENEVLQTGINAFPSNSEDPTNNVNHSVIAKNAILEKEIEKLKAELNELHSWLDASHSDGRRSSVGGYLSSPEGQHADDVDGPDRKRGKVFKKLQRDNNALRARLLSLENETTATTKIIADVERGHGHLTGILRGHLILQKSSSAKLLDSSLQQYQEEHDALKRKFTAVEHKFDKENQNSNRRSYAWDLLKNAEATITNIQSIVAEGLLKVEDDLERDFPNDPDFESKDYRSRLWILRRRLSDVENRYRELQVKAEELNLRLDAKTAEYEMTQDELEEVTKDLELNEVSLAKLRKELTGNNRENGQLKDLMKDLKTNQEDTVSAVINENEDLKEKIEKTRKETEDKENLIRDELKINQKRIKEKDNEMEILRKALATTRKEAEKLKTKNEELIGENEKITAELNALKQELETKNWKGYIEVHDNYGTMHMLRDDLKKLWKENSILKQDNLNKQRTITDLAKDLRNASIDTQERKRVDSPAREKKRENLKVPTDEALPSNRDNSKGLSKELKSYASPRESARAADTSIESNDATMELIKTKDLELEILKRENGQQLTKIQDLNNLIEQLKSNDTTKANTVKDKMEISRLKEEVAELRLENETLDTALKDQEKQWKDVVDRTMKDSETTFEKQKKQLEYLAIELRQKDEKIDQLQKKLRELRGAVAPDQLSSDSTLHRLNQLVSQLTETDNNDKNMTDDAEHKLWRSDSDSMSFADRFPTMFERKDLDETTMSVDPIDKSYEDMKRSSTRPGSLALPGRPGTSADGRFSSTDPPLITSSTTPNDYYIESSGKPTYDSPTRIPTSTGKHGHSLLAKEGKISPMEKSSKETRIPSRVSATKERTDEPSKRNNRNEGEARSGQKDGKEKNGGKVRDETYIDAIARLSRQMRELELEVENGKLAVLAEKEKYKEESTMLNDLLSEIIEMFGVQSNDNSKKGKLEIVRERLRESAIKNKEKRIDKKTTRDVKKPVPSPRKPLPSKSLSQKGVGKKNEAQLNPKKQENVRKSLNKKEETQIPLNEKAQAVKEIPVSPGKSLRGGQKSSLAVKRMAKNKSSPMIHESSTLHPKRTQNDKEVAAEQLIRAVASKLGILVDKLDLIDDMGRKLNDRIDELLTSERQADRKVEEETAVSSRESILDQTDFSGQDDANKQPNEIAKKTVLFESFCADVTGTSILVLQEMDAELLESFIKDSIQDYKEKKPEELQKHQQSAFDLMVTIFELDVSIRDLNGIEKQIKKHKVDSEEMKKENQHLKIKIKQWKELNEAKEKEIEFLAEILKACNVIIDLDYSDLKGLEMKEIRRKVENAVNTTKVKLRDYDKVKTECKHKAEETERLRRIIKDFKIIEKEKEIESEAVHRETKVRLKDESVVEGENVEIEEFSSSAYKHEDKNEEIEHMEQRNKENVVSSLGLIDSRGKRNEDEIDRWITVLDISTKERENLQALCEVYKQEITQLRIQLDAKLKESNDVDSMKDIENNKEIIETLENELQRKDQHIIRLSNAIKVVEKQLSTRESELKQLMTRSLQDDFEKEDLKAVIDDLRQDKDLLVQKLRRKEDSFDEREEVVIDLERRERELRDLQAKLELLKIKYAEVEEERDQLAKKAEIDNQEKENMKIKLLEFHNELQQWKNGKDQNGGTYNDGDVGDLLKDKNETPIGIIAMTEDLMVKLETCKVKSNEEIQGLKYVINENRKDMEELRDRIDVLEDDLKTAEVALEERDITYLGDLKNLQNVSAEQSGRLHEKDMVIAELMKQLDNR